MKLIDRLIIEAQKMSGLAGQQIVFAYVERDGDCWRADVHLWDLIPGHPGNTISSTHVTQETAIEHIRAVAKQFPNSRDVAIIVDDV